MFCKTYDAEKNVLRYGDHVLLNARARSVELFELVAEKLDVPRNRRFWLLSETRNGSFSEVKDFATLEQARLAPHRTLASVGSFRTA